MDGYVLHFRININDNLENYLDFRRDLFKCCKTNPIITEVSPGIFNVYIQEVFKMKLKEIEKNYPELVIS